MLYTFLCLKFAEAMEDKAAKAIEGKAKRYNPDIKYALLDFTPMSPIIGICQVFLGCYLKTQRDVIVHLNQVRGLPPVKKSYIKIKVSPDTDKSSKNVYPIDEKKDCMEFDKYIKVKKTNKLIQCFYTEDTSQWM